MTRALEISSPERFQKKIKKGDHLSILVKAIEISMLLQSEVSAC